MSSTESTTSSHPDAWFESRPLQAPTPAKRRAMQAQRTQDTAPELALRRELHRRGLRYFIHRRPLRTLRREADLVFSRAKVAVFVDGCFWHGCPDHGTSPKSNAEWWGAKLTGNRERDADTDETLRAAGWAVVRVWEHELAADAANRVEMAVRRTPHDHRAARPHLRTSRPQRSDEPTIAGISLANRSPTSALRLARAGERLGKSHNDALPGS